MLSTRRYFLGFFGLLCISLTSGCGEGAHEVKGKVTLDGEPVAGANVTFTKADNSITAGAMTLPTGRSPLVGSAKAASRKATTTCSSQNSREGAREIPRRRLTRMTFTK